jgi:hypothetical protein
MEEQSKMNTGKFNKYVPEILKDIKKKNDKLDYGLYIVDVGKGEERETLRILNMESYIGIVDENEELTHVFINDRIIPYLSDDDYYSESISDDESQEIGSSDDESDK